MATIQINSDQNPKIRLVRKLQSSHSLVKTNYFFAEGKRTCKTLVESELVPQFVLTTEENKDECEKIFNPTSTTILITSKKLLNSLCNTEAPSGIAAVFQKLPLPLERPDTPSLVAVEISDPGNMGTLIRTAVGLGFKSFITLGGVSQWNNKVVRASVGTIAKIPIYNWTLDNLTALASQETLTGLVCKGGKPPNSVSQKEAFLAVGSEAHGLPDEVVAICDSLVTIPMQSGAESLNAAVAASIAMYEIQRSRQP